MKKSAKSKTSPSMGKGQSGENAWDKVKHRFPERYTKYSSDRREFLGAGQGVVMESGLFVLLTQKPEEGQDTGIIGYLPDDREFKPFDWDTLPQKDARFEVYTKSLGTYVKITLEVEFQETDEILKKSLWFVKKVDQTGPDKEEHALLFVMVQEHEWEDTCAAVTHTCATDFGHMYRKQGFFIRKEPSETVE